MGLFSILHKNKQEPTSDDSEFTSRAAEESKAIRGRGKRKQKGQDSDSDDLVLPEKKRARRRLVGALALVLAVVIGLPMILDSEPKPLADDIAIQIPSKDKPTPQSGRQPLAASPAVTDAPAQAEAPVVKAPVPVAEPITPPAGELKNLPEAGKGTAKVEAVPPLGEKPVAKTDAAAHKPEKIEKPSSDKAAAKSPSKTDETARAMAILEGKSGEEVKAASVAVDKKSGKYAIQVAALSSKEKINELQGKLKTAGIQSYTQKIATASGQSTRIRVGPFASKAEAEKMRTKLVKAGLNGTVIPPTQ
jgi:DedD protein